MKQQTRDTSHLLHKAFVLPRKCWSDMKEVVIRELDGIDDDKVANIMDAMEIPDTASIMERMRIEQAESVKQSIVLVDGNPASQDGFAFPGYDKLRRCTKASLGTFFNDLNGVDSAELGKCLKSGKPLDPTTMKPVIQGTIGSPTGEEPSDD